MQQETYSRNHARWARVLGVMSADPDSEQHAVLEGLFEAHFGALLAYARRGTAQLSDAEDVVAETFTVAWRRMGDLPANEAERLPWLYGIARRVLANQRRSTTRRHRLHERLQVSMVTPATGLSSLPSTLEALARLRDDDQEILRLVAWEDLTHAEIALSGSVGGDAEAIHLHRARRRLEAELKGSAASRTWLGWKGSVKPNATISERTGPSSITSSGSEKLRT